LNCAEHASRLLRRSVAALVWAKCRLYGRTACEGEETRLNPGQPCLPSPSDLCELVNVLTEMSLRISKLAVSGSLLYSGVGSSKAEAEVQSQTKLCLRLRAII